ncbi:MAG: hypothetical protein AAFR39_01715 [Pseudomonadota bacterium]
MFSYLSRLPGWLQNLTALAFLLLFVLWTISPKVIVGKYECVNSNGDPCVDTSFEVAFDGHSVESKTRKDRFVVPVSSPFGNVIAYLYTDVDDLRISSEPIIFNMPDFWSVQEYKVTLKQDDTTGKIELAEIEAIGRNWMGGILDMAAAIDIPAMLGRAQAAEIMTWDQALNLKSGELTELSSEQLSAEASTEIDTALTEVIMSAGGTQADFSDVELEALNKLLGEKLGTGVAPQHWDLISNKAALAGYIKSQRNLGIELTVSPSGALVDGWGKVASDFAAENGKALVVVPDVVIERDFSN